MDEIGYVAQVRGADGAWYPIRTLQGPPGPVGPQGPEGKPGSGLHIKGIASSPDGLPENAEQSEFWFVGAGAPYEVYMFNNGEWEPIGGLQGAPGVTFRPTVVDGVLSWTNDGGLNNPEAVNVVGPQGPEGPPGADGKQGPAGPAGPQGATGLTGLPGPEGRKGATYVPSISPTGVLSWTNDGGLNNPEAVNVVGPQGPEGPPGADGKGPYELAKENGYSGTESTFNMALTQFPAHRTRHEEGGADQVSVTTGLLVDGAVTAVKLAADAKSKGVAVVLSKGGWSGNSQTVNVEGVHAAGSPNENNIITGYGQGSREAFNDAEIECTTQGEGTLTFTCGSVPATDINVNVIILV